MLKRLPSDAVLLLLTVASIAGLLVAVLGARQLTVSDVLPSTGTPVLTSADR